MPNIPDNPEPKEWHRFFAVELNNRAWQLVEQSRTPDEDLAMLNAAHASAYHWNVVGTALHKMRATMLLAEVHAVLGFGESALAMAEEARAFFQKLDTPDWELAYTYTIYAHAAFAADKIEEYKSSYQDAVRSIEAIAEDEDRAIVLRTFNQVPVP